MTKRFNITIINGKPTCAELAGYELPEFEPTPIAIEVEFTDPAPGDWQPILNPDGTVKGTYIFNE